MLHKGTKVGLFYGRHVTPFIASHTELFTFQTTGENTVIYIPRMPKAFLEASGPC